MRNESFSDWIVNQIFVSFRRTAVVLVMLGFAVALMVNGC